MRVWFTIGLTGQRDIHTYAVADARSALRNELEPLREQSPQTRKLEAVEEAGLAVDRSDLVIWVKALRQAGEVEQGEVQTVYMVRAGATGLICRLPHIPDSVLERWSQFDQYTLKRDTATGPDLTAYPISTPDDIKISEIASSVGVGFVRADQLALANQRQSDRLFKLFGLMAALMGLTFLFYAKIAVLKLFLIAYEALFAGGLIFFAIGSRRGWFGRLLEHEPPSAG